MITILHTIWRMSFQACILILIVLIARQLLRKYSAFYTRLLWLLVIVRLLCPVFIETDFSLLPEFSAVQTEKVSDGKAAASLVSAALAANQLADNFTRQAFRDTEAIPPSSAPNAADRFFSGDNQPPNAQTMISVPENGVFLPQTTPSPNTTKSAPESGAPKPAALSPFFRLLSALYLFGAAATAVIFSAQFLRLKRRLSTAVCESGNVWLCENIASPFVLGILRPKIILPYHMEPEAKAHVLSHERTHIRHCDPLLHFAGTTCLCLHWWNPFVWLAVHK